MVAGPQRLAEHGEHLGRLGEERVDQLDREIFADAVAEGVVGASIDRCRVHLTDLTLRHRKQRLDERLGIDRLGDVVVHSRSQAHFPIARHRVRRHGNDPGPVVRHGVDDAPARLQPVHLRHLYVHQDDVVDLAIDRLHRLEPVGCEVAR